MIDLIEKISKKQKKSVQDYKYMYWLWLELRKTDVNTAVKYMVQ